MVQSAVAEKVDALAPIGALNERCIRYYVKRFDAEIDVIRADFEADKLPDLNHEKKRIVVVTVSSPQNETLADLLTEMYFFDNYPILSVWKNFEH